MTVRKQSPLYSLPAPSTPQDLSLGALSSMTTSEAGACNEYRLVYFDSQRPAMYFRTHVWEVGTVVGGGSLTVDTCSQPSGGPVLDTMMSVLGCTVNAQGQVTGCSSCITDDDGCGVYAGGSKVALTTTDPALTYFAVVYPYSS
jgi:hypothetical protein